jgi:hypothetical protein
LIPSPISDICGACYRTRIEDPAGTKAVCLSQWSYEAPAPPTSAGQLESLLGHGHTDVYLPPEAARKVTARAVVVQSVCEAWKIGRGRPVNREILSAAGVTGAFVDRVADRLARDGV